MAGVTGVAYHYKRVPVVPEPVFLFRHSPWGNRRFPAIGRCTGPTRWRAGDEVRGRILICGNLLQNAILFGKLFVL